MNKYAIPLGVTWLFISIVVGILLFLSPPKRDETSLNTDTSPRVSYKASRRTVPNNNTNTSRVRVNIGEPEQAAVARVFIK